MPKTIPKTIHIIEDKKKAPTNPVASEVSKAFFAKSPENPENSAGKHHVRGGSGIGTSKKFRWFNARVKKWSRLFSPHFSDLLSRVAKGCDVSECLMLFE